MTARAATLAALLIVTDARLSAHHSFSLFDMEKEVTYKGVVSEYRWMNPHVHITVGIKAAPGIDPGAVGTCDVEGGSTTITGRQGWTRATFKAGDPIALVGHPMKDGSKGISLFYVILPDGSRLYHDIARPKGEAGQ